MKQRKGFKVRLEEMLTRSNFSSY